MLQEELKKIWRPKFLLALLILGFVFYTMFLEFFIRQFPENYGGASGRGILKVSSGLVKKYGTALSEKEMEETASQLEQLYTEAEAYIQIFPTGIKNNMETYEDYEAFLPETDGESLLLYKCAVSIQQAALY